MPESHILPHPSPLTEAHTPVWQQMANFIARTEMEKQQPPPGEKIYRLLHEKIQDFEQQLQTAVKELQTIKPVLSRIGAAEIITHSERLVEKNRHEIQQLSAVYQQTCQQVTGQCEQLNRTNLHMIKNIAQMATQARQANLLTLQQKEMLAVQQTCQHTLQQADRMGKHFQWKTLGVVVLLVMVVASIINLYSDNEWPEQMHYQVSEERQAGQTLLKNWPELDNRDKRVILQYM